MAHGAMWSLVEKAGSQGISFIVFMFVARLIGPKEFGLANICFLIYYLPHLVILGVADGIVSLQINDARRLSTMFWCVIGGGCFLTLSIIAGAPGVASLMGDPRLESLLRWFSLVFLCMTALVVPNKLAYAALDFRILALRTLTASVASGVVGLVLAFQGLGAYAIIAQQIVLYFVMNIIVWRYVDWRPHFVFDVSVLKASLLPGFKTMGSDVIFFAEYQIPPLFIGGDLGPVALGYYAFVMRICFALLEITINPVLTVLYPFLTKIKEDHDEQKLILGQVISLMGTLMFPILALGADTAPLYVPLFFGTAWIPAVPVLQFFLCGSSVLPILITIRESVRAHNKIGSYLKVQVPVVIFGLLVTVILLPHGLVAMSAGVVACTFCIVPVYAYFFKHWVSISLWQPIARLVRPLMAVVMMLVAVHLFKSASFYPQNAWGELFSVLALGVAVYLSACFLVQRQEIMKAISFAKKISPGKDLPSLAA